MPRLCQPCLRYPRLTQPWHCLRAHEVKLLQFAKVIPKSEIPDTFGPTASWERLELRARLLRPQQCCCGELSVAGQEPSVLLMPLPPSFPDLPPG